MKPKLLFPKFTHLFFEQRFLFQEAGFNKTGGTISQEKPKEKPVTGKERKEAAKDQTEETDGKFEAFQARINQLIEQGKALSAVENAQFMEQVRGEMDRLFYEIQQDASLNQQERAILLNMIQQPKIDIEKEIAKYVKDKAEKAGERAKEIAMSALNWAKENVEDYASILGGAVAGAGALLFAPITAPYAAYKYIQSTGAEKQQETQKEQLRALADKGNKDAQAALTALETVNKQEELAKEAERFAMEHADADYFGDEINAYSGDAVKIIDQNGTVETRYYSYRETQKIVRGMIAAAYQLGGEAEAQRVIAELRQRQDKKGVRLDAVETGDAIGVLNDKDNAGIGGDRFSKFERNEKYNDASLAVKAYAITLLSRAKKTLNDSQYSLYEQAVEKALADISAYAKNQGILDKAETFGKEKAADLIGIGSDALLAKFMLECPKIESFSQPVESRVPQPQPQPAEQPAQQPNTKAPDKKSEKPGRGRRAAVSTPGATRESRSGSQDRSPSREQGKESAEKSAVSITPIFEDKSVLDQRYGGDAKPILNPELPKWAKSINATAFTGKGYFNVFGPNKEKLVAYVQYDRNGKPSATYFKSEEEPTM